MFVSLNNNTTDVTSVAETSNPSRAPELIPVINGVRVFKFLDFCVVFCRREWCIQQSSSISMGTEDQVKHNMQ